MLFSIQRCGPRESVGLGFRLSFYPCRTDTMLLESCKIGRQLFRSSCDIVDVTEDMIDSVSI